LIDINGEGRGWSRRGAKQWEGTYKLLLERAGARKEEEEDHVLPTIRLDVEKKMAKRV
jgi:hypothetical protein